MTITTTRTRMKVGFDTSHLQPDYCILLVAADKRVSKGLYLSVRPSISPSMMTELWKSHSFFHFCQQVRDWSCYLFPSFHPSILIHISHLLSNFCIVTFLSDQGLTSADVPMWVFGAKHVKLLTEHLARVQLPGLTSLDQMYLVALADVVASIRQEGIHTKSYINICQNGKSLLSCTLLRGFVATILWPRVTCSFSTGETNGSASKSTDPVDAIKDCGLRFLAAMRHHAYLLRTLPMGQRAPLKQKGEENTKSAGSSQYSLFGLKSL